MIPILYESNEKEFISGGIGWLNDAITCQVVEERNGIYELEMVYPVDGSLYEEIKEDRIILAKPNETDRDQPFRIYNITAPLNGKVTINAEHLSYQTTDIPVFPFVAESAPAAVAGMKTYSAVENPFNFTTDKQTVATFRITEPVSFRSMLHSKEGSLVDVYGGGDYKFDRWNIYLLANRGQDNGVTIEYGKNLTDLKQEKSIESLLHGVAPFWTNGEGSTVTLPEKIIVIQNDYSYSRIQPLDLSGDFEEAPTVDELRAAANRYLETTDLTTPRVSLTVSFIPLWLCENYKENPLYKQIQGLERVSLCDTITVRFDKLGVNAKTRVIKTTFDVLKERYISIELGEPRNTAITRSASQQVQISNATSKSQLEQAIWNATNAITGATGGYVVLDPPTNPQRLLIMDAPNKEDAVNVWQWSLGGLGFSSNGVDGPYETAITNDGKIVADFITVGTLLANIIRGGVISATDGKSYWDLDGSAFHAKGILTGTPNEYDVEITNGALNVYINGAYVGGFRGITLSGNARAGAFSQYFYLKGSSEESAVAYYNEATKKTTVSADTIALRQTDDTGLGVLWMDGGNTVLSVNTARADTVYVNGTGPFRPRTITTDVDGTMTVLARG